jgi:hypothetical protein
MEEGLIMTSKQWFYQLLFATLVLVCLIIHVWWPNPLPGALAPSILSRACDLQQPGRRHGRGGGAGQKSGFLFPIH